MHKGPSQGLAGLAVLVDNTNILTLHYFQTCCSSKPCELLGCVKVGQGPIPTPVQVPPYALISWDAQLDLQAQQTS
jgi:hypothetical protein